MKSKLSFKLLNRTFYSFIFALISVSVIIACRKNEHQPEQLSKAETISAAKDFFNQEVAEIPLSKLKLMQMGSIRHSLGKTAMWDLASVRKISIGDAVIVPIKYGEKVFSKNLDNQKGIDLEKSSYLMVYKDKKQKMHAEWVTMIPIGRSSNGKFAGIIEVEEWDGISKKAFAIGIDGSVRNVYLSSSNNLRKISLAYSSDCFTVEYYGWVGVEGHMYQQVIGSETYCFGSSGPGQGSYDSSAPQDNSGGNNNSDNPAPGDYPSVVDCAGVLGGSAEVDPSCNTCIGGTTGLTACPPVADIKKDSLKKYYPCMDKLVLQKLENDTLYSKLIKPFQNIYIPGAGQVSFAGLPKITYHFSSQVWGTGNQYKLGETENTTAANSAIYFNTQAMQNASQLLLQVAVIHETAHAYLTYYIKMGTWGQTIQEGGDFPWALKMANYGVIATGQYMTGNYTDHSIFLNHYLSETIAILKSVNGSAYTNQEYIMAAMYGMDNPGTIPLSLATIPTGQTYFNTLKNQLTASYNNILTQNGITSAMINTFYTNNLSNVPANKKLPNNCP